MLCVHNGSAFRFSSKTEVYVECLAWRAMTAMGRKVTLGRSTNKPIFRYDSDIEGLPA